MHYPELVEPAKLILKKCNRLPLAIVTIGGFLADQPTKTAVEWRKLNEHISVELEMNPKFEAIKTVLMKSYDGLPYYLKACFLYLSIFPEDYCVSRRRLVCRWIAEGYSQNRSIADRYFMELVERSMILPIQFEVCSIKGFDFCHLHDLIRDICIAKSMEENLVFRLEEGCNSSTRGAVRHLAISSSWRGDEFELESTVELSHVRSLTVFGKCRPFYISDKMRFLRVLDLQGTTGLTSHHLERIGKLLHLRYLSLRACEGLYYLPDSVGNLRQLETLDIKYTRILMLPKTITKLTKLRYLKAGSTLRVYADWPLRYLQCCVPELLACCLPGRMCFNKRCAERRFTIEHYGVKVPRGIGKLKTLHTLQHMHCAQEIKDLTSLRKLGVVGINRKNGPEFCSAISSLSRLESLSLQSRKLSFDDSLHGMYSPPENLQSLKVHGNLGKLPGWIKGLQNLVKLKLIWTQVFDDSETIQVLGNLSNLSILGLVEGSSSEGSFTFQSGLFRSLTVLELEDTEVISVKFESASMPKLEVLSLTPRHSTTVISGLEFLPSIKEVRLDVKFYYEFDTTEEAEKEAKHMEDKVTEDLVKQLASNQNKPILKMRVRK
jgi:Leucine-rich repeat (LRR) protein